MVGGINILFYQVYTINTLFLFSFIFPQCSQFICQYIYITHRNCCITIFSNFFSIFFLLHFHTLTAYLLNIHQKPKQNVYDQAKNQSSIIMLILYGCAYTYRQIHSLYLWLPPQRYSLIFRHWFPSHHKMIWRWCIVDNGFI